MSFSPARRLQAVLAAFILMFLAPACNPAGEDESPQPLLTVTPLEFNFYEVDIGKPVQTSFTLTNGGDGLLEVSSVTLSGSTNPYTFDVDTSFKINPGTSKTLTVTFKPVVTGMAEASLAILSNASDNPSVVITLKGTGISPDADQDGYAVDRGDCNDSDPSINPIAKEVCNDKDDNCNGKVDDKATDATDWYADSDGDGYGDAADRDSVSSCTEPKNSADNKLDCNDSNAAISPAASEVCDTVDNDCDKQIDEGFDSNGDGIADCNDLDGDGFSGGNGDCNDAAPWIYPGAEEIPSNNQDDDCDGFVDENSAPTITFVEPEDGAFIAPGPVTLKTVVLDDYDPATSLLVDFFTQVNGEPARPLCEAVVPDGNGEAWCDTDLEYGLHEIQVLAMDMEAAQGEGSLTLVMDDAPSVIFRSPTSGLTVAYGAPTQFTISISDPNETLTYEAVTWTSTLQGQIEPDRVVIQGDQVTATLTLVRPGTQEITAALYDSLGAVATASVEVIVLSPDCSTQDAVALWRFDEQTGVTFMDQISGLVGTGTAVSHNSQSLTPAFSYALAFSGTGSELSVADPAKLLSLSAFTIDFWFRTNGRAEQAIKNQALIYKNGDPGNGDKPNYYLSINANGNLEATIARPPAGALTAVGSTVILGSAWYHIAVTFDGRSLRIYNNGAEDGAVTADAQFTPRMGDSPMYVGVNKDATRILSLSGLMDDLQILTCALSLDQIHDYYVTQAPHELYQEPTPTPEVTPEVTPTPEVTATPAVTPTPGTTTTPEVTPTATPIVPPGG